MRSLKLATIRFSSFFVIILLCLISRLGNAATITWDGSSGTEWTTAANWSSNSVPTASDNVIIPNGVPNDPIITTSVTITSMIISEGGKLTILLSGTLTVDGAAASGITVRGQLTNNGKLYIDNTGLHGLQVFAISGSAKAYLYGDTYIGSSGTIGGSGIYVEDELVVDTDPVNQYDLTPILTIDNTTENGITCSGCTAYIRESGTGISTPTTTVKIGTTGSIGVNGILSNGDFNFLAGTVTIEDNGGTENGLVNFSGGNFSMSSNATLNIGSASAQMTGNGIENQDQFSSAGSININNIVLDGIYNTANGTFSNTGSGDIQIGTVASIGGNGVQNDGNFSMNNNATLTIGSATAQISGNGIENQDQFSSAGNITVNNTGNFGLSVNSQGIFTNNGTITIGNLAETGQYGITVNGTSSIFHNNSIVNVEASYTSGIGIESSGTWNNNSNAQTNVGQSGLDILVSDIVVNSNGSFYNQGGSVNVDNAYIGLSVWATGNFENNNGGTIELGASIIDKSISSDNGTVFLNAECSEIIQIGETTITGSNIVNNGWIIDYSSKNNNIKTNNGTVQNLNGGTFTITNNNGTLTTAEGKFWTGCINTDWHETGNWADDAVPGSTDDVVILEATNDPIIKSGNTANIQSLTILANGELRNNGTLNVQGASGDGILNEGGLNNYGELRVDGTAGSGIYNKDGATFSNESTAELWLGNDSGAIGSYGIRNANLSLFNNLGGTVYIDNTSDHAFFNDDAYFACSSNSEFNIGTQSGGIGGAGIFNTGATGYIVNFASTIQIDQATSYGIVNETLFRNEADGEVNFGANTGTASLNNTATGIWNNKDCSVASFFNGLSNSGQIDNDAFFYFNTAAAHGNSGTFTNDGILSYTSTNTVLNVTNNGIIIEPINLECGYVAYNALQIGGSNTFTVLDEWFSDSGLSNKAGDYNQSGNTFTATSLLSGTNTLYFTATNGTCTFDLTIETTATTPSTQPAGERTWTGAVSSDWDYPCNWSPANVPTSADGVIIPNVTTKPVISGSTNAEAAWVKINANSVLTISAGGSMTLHGFAPASSITYDHTCTFLSLGTVHNNGTITIGANGVAGEIGLMSYKKFLNKSGSTVHIDNTSLWGVWNYLEFENEGTFTIGANGSVGEYGIYNNLSFKNKPGALFQIDNTTRAGIFNDDNFQNESIITIGSNTSVGNYGIENSGVFTNETTGQINIDNSTIAALYNDIIFTNSGVVNIGANASIGHRGIINEEHNFYNYGFIYIDNANSFGIENKGDKFFNYGKIEMGAIASVGPTAIKNSNALTNEGCEAWINIISNSIITDNGNFVNNGILTENASGNSNISTNNFIVQNLNGGAFTIANDNGFVVEDDLTIWTGCTSSAWDEASNWFPSVPTAADEVTIPDMAIDPVISAATSAVCNGITVQVDATLTIVNGGSLTIDNAVNGMNISGMVSNNGTIDIGQNGGGITVAGAIVNSLGSLIVQSNGTLNIDNTGEDAMEVEGSFTNTGLTNIGQNGGADNIGWNGINFNGDVSNSGMMNIDHTANRGLWAFGNFTNTGTLNIGQNGGVGSIKWMAVRQAAGNFYNQTGGVINIDNANRHGLELLGNFYNQAYIYLGFGGGTLGTTSSHYGLKVLDGNFENTNGGFIYIDNSMNNGILTDGSATFFNGECSTINNFDAFNVLNASTFTNNGFLRVDFGGTNSISNFINNGGVEDNQGTVIGGTNNEIIVAPTTATDCNEINPAFDLGTTVDFNILGVFFDSNGSSSAGTYDVATNTFTPTTPLSSGTYTFWVEVEDPNNGCSKFHSWEVDATGIQEVTCYLDSDGDGYGDNNVSQIFCSVCGTGYVSDNSDCNDTDPNVTPNPDCSGTARTWTGHVSTDWDEPCNWSPNCVPTDMDEITIPDVANDPVIGSGSTAYAKKITVENDAHLTIENTGVLDMSVGYGFSSNTFHINNFGNVTNSGHIIGSDAGFYKDDLDAVFDNYGIVDAAGVYDDIFFMIGTVNNHTGGEINISFTALDAIQTKGSFSNSGLIHISNFEDTGLAITNYDSGTFINQSSGTILFEGKVWGVTNTSNAVFDNYGYIAKIAAPNGVYFIDNYAIFNNHEGGTIEALNYCLRGIENLSTGTFTNSGTVEIGDLPQLGIENLGTFVNATCGEIYLADILQTSASFTNQGLLSLNTSQTHSISGTFANEGIIEDVQGTFSGGTNNEIIVAPVTTADCNEVSPAFDLGTQVDFNILGIYIDAGATQSAGTYDVVTNTFISTISLSSGTNIFYVEIEDPTGGCVAIVEWEVEAMNSQTITCYLDSDGDGYGDANVSQEFFCNCGNGYISDNTDCNDDDPNVNPNPDCSVGIINWTGHVSSDWDDPCNWSPNCVPMTDHKVIISNVGNSPVIGSTTSAFIKSMLLEEDVVFTVEAGGILDINGALGVGLNLSSGVALHNDGIIEIDNTSGNGFRVVFASVYNNGTINVGLVDGIGTAGITGSGTSNNVFINNGTIAVGNTGNFAFGIAMTPNQIINNGTLKGVGDFYLSDHDLGGTFAPGNSPGTATFIGDQTFTASNTLEIEVNGTTPDSEHDVLEVEGTATISGTLSVSIGYTPNSNDRIVFLTATAISGTFGTISPALPADWTVDYSVPGEVALVFSGVLPVELVYFSVKKEDEKAVLNWQTASETNNVGFDIEHSTDGREWNTIGFVEGHGNSTEAHSYFFLHESPSHGTNYYRLRQMDFDGNFEYSNIRSVQFDSDGNEIRVFPNPATTYFNIQFLAEYEQAIIRLFDAEGRLVMEEKTGDRQSLLRMEVGKLVPGQYFLIIQTGNKSFTQKLQINKD